MTEFTLDIPRIGYIIAVRYERQKKFNIFGEGIFQKQLWAGFDDQDALYVHAAISSGEDYLVNVMPPRAKLVSLTKVYGGHYIKILKYNGENYDNLVRYKIGCIYNAIASNLGYDWWGIFNFLLPRIKQAKQRFFCSEACATAYQIFYPTIFGGVPPEKIMPAHFVRDFDLVWEGVIPKHDKKSIRQTLRQGLTRAKAVFAMA